VGRVVQPPPRLRSQAFSTSQRFTQTRVPRPCFMPQPVPGLPSLQSLPLTEIVVPSRGHQLPCSHPPECGIAPTSALSPPVSPTPAPATRLPGSPDGYGSPFHEPEPASRSPWTSDGGVGPYPRPHLLRSLAPPVNPFASRRVAPTRRPMLSWACAPPETLPSLGASDPPEPEGPNAAFVRRLRRATSRTVALAAG